MRKVIEKMMRKNSGLVSEKDIERESETRIRKQSKKR